MNPNSALEAAARQAREVLLTAPAALLELLQATSASEEQPEETFIPFSAVFGGPPSNFIGITPWLHDVNPRTMVVVGSGLDCLPLAPLGPTSTGAWLLLAGWHDMPESVWDENVEILRQHEQALDDLDLALGGDGRWRQIPAWFATPENRARAALARGVDLVRLESEILLALSPDPQEAAFRHALATLGEGPGPEEQELGPWWVTWCGHVLYHALHHGGHPRAHTAARAVLQAMCGVGTAVAAPGHLPVPVAPLSLTVLRSAALILDADPAGLPGHDGTRRLVAAILKHGAAYDGFEHAELSKELALSGAGAQAFRHAWSAWYLASLNPGRDMSWEQGVVAAAVRGDAPPW